MDEVVEIGTAVVGVGEVDENTMDEPPSSGVWVNGIAVVVSVKDDGKVVAGGEKVEGVIVVG